MAEIAKEILCGVSDKVGNQVGTYKLDRKKRC